MFANSVGTQYNEFSLLSDIYPVVKMIYDDDLRVAINDYLFIYFIYYFISALYMTSAVYVG